MIWGFCQWALYLPRCEKTTLRPLRMVVMGGLEPPTCGL